MSLHWIAPTALVALAAAAGPVIVHLLRRQRAPRVPFPTIQFLSPTQAAAARLQRPSDLALLALRMAAVALASNHRPRRVGRHNNAPGTFDKVWHGSHQVKVPLRDGGPEAKTICDAAQAQTSAVRRTMRTEMERRM